MVSVYKKTNIANFGWKALRTPPLGEGHQASCQLSDASTPLCMVILLLTTFGRVIHLSSTSSRSSLETSYFHS